MVAANALSAYEVDDIDTFIMCADWLYDSQWLYRFDWVAPGYRLSAPWISSMAHGMAISALVRASEMTRKVCYRERCRMELESFKADSKRGGLRSIDADGNVWYDEYPCCPHVLNGMLFALNGLFDMGECGLSAAVLFNDGVRTILDVLPRFELNLGLFRWSRYDDRWLFWSGRKYHAVHVDQLRWLASATGHGEFIETANRWEGFAERYSGGVGEFAVRCACWAIDKASRAFFRVYDKEVR